MAALTWMMPEISDEQRGPVGGNCAAESEFFGRAGLSAMLNKDQGKGVTVRGLRVEELVERLAGQLMPLVDRSNRMMLRNLKALKDHRRPPSANLNITQAQQVNVGGQQINVAADDS